MFSIVMAGVIVLPTLALGPPSAVWDEALAVQLNDQWACSLVELNHIANSRPDDQSFMTATALCADSRAFDVEGPNAAGVYLITFQSAQT